MAIMKIQVVPEAKITIEPDPENPPTLEELQKFVGGYIEIVYFRGQQLIVNEDGLRLKLPVNLEASRFYGNTIVGNAIVLSGPHKLD